LDDDQNCGMCGVACTDGQTCNAGQCACTSGQLNDPQNCGSCGSACPPMATCDMQPNGTFTCSCSSSDTVCNGNCVDLDNDVNNCGMCDTVCTGGSTTNPICRGGMCALVCKPNRGNCDGLNFNGCEADLLGRTSCGANCTTAVNCGWNDTCSASGGTAHCECDDGNVCNPGEYCDPGTNGIDRCTCN